MKLNNFISALKLAHDTPNGYNNTPGKNLGYHWSNGKFTFDCWNLIKVVLAGWNATNPVGTNVKPTVTGDIDGYTMLTKCSERSKDFSKLKKPGTYLYIYTSPHAGVYIGDFTYKGKVYNVVECTVAWDGGVIYSYVDKSGYRYQYKGGSKNKYKWEEYGLLPWVEYTVEPEQKTYSQNDIVYFLGGKDYNSSSAKTSTSNKPASLAKITKVANGSHPYHVRRVDEKLNFKSGGVYGWVDADVITV